MKKILYYILPILLMAAGSGCKKDFLDINQNPNQPTDESITPELILPRSLHAIGARMATSYRVQASWMGYWARSGTYGPNAEEESYNISTGFEVDEFAGWYDILTDLNTMQKKAQTLNQSYYVGIAKIMKTVGFMYLVDQYNNVPYTKAFDLSGNILPAYDNGQVIYNDLMVQLNDAVALINAADVSANTGLSTADIMFQGNKAKWIKFANTQHLKLLLRQAYIPGFSPTAEIAKITANGGGYLMTGETASVQPGYTIDNGKQNPFWNTYKKLYTGGGADDFNRANNFILNILRNSNDPRYQYYFSVAAIPLSGNTYYGFNYGESLPNSDPYKANNSSDVAGPGLAKSATQPQWVFTATESLFLQAEAAARGWIPGSAQALTTTAITESFTWLGVSGGATAAATYIAANAGNPLTNTTVAGTPEQQARIVVMQKYLGLVGVNNFEAWVDWRRIPGTQGPTIATSTTIPPVPFSMSTSRNGRHIPLRLQYPQDEYNYNAANVGGQGVIDPQNSRIFWDIN